jgi:hypothetical protein
MLCCYVVVIWVLVHLRYDIGCYYRSGIIRCAAAAVDNELARQQHST